VGDFGAVAGASQGRVFLRAIHAHHRPAHAHPVVAGRSGAVLIVGARITAVVARCRRVARARLPNAGAELCYNAIVLEGLAIAAAHGTEVGEAVLRPQSTCSATSITAR